VSLPLCCVLNTLAWASLLALDRAIVLMFGNDCVTHHGVLLYFIYWLINFFNLRSSVQSFSAYIVQIFIHSSEFHSCFNLRVCSVLQCYLLSRFFSASSLMWSVLLSWWHTWCLLFLFGSLSAVVHGHHILSSDCPGLQYLKWLWLFSRFDEEMLCKCFSKCCKPLIDEYRLILCQQQR
jgi:hypothetical protein